MATYKNPALRQFTDQQVRFAPREVRLQQIDRAEKLLDEIRQDREYQYPELCRRITSHHTDLYPDLKVAGTDAAHDLRLFIEDLSDSADIPAESAAEKVYTVEEVSREF